MKESKYPGAKRKQSVLILGQFKGVVGLPISGEWVFLNSVSSPQDLMGGVNHSSRLPLKERLLAKCTLIYMNTQPSGGGVDPVLQNLRKPNENQDLSTAPQWEDH